MTIVLILNRSACKPLCLPSSQLAPLATIMLKVKLLDMGEPRTLLSTALSPPNLNDIVRTVLQLKEVLKAHSSTAIRVSPGHERQSDCCSSSSS